ncbi:hypothetical protein BT69DRAFT_707937 [Atractiella rhizophila]|nr:hypothetical protein BT69DRAFT_707937 [Atractiella rhizophila]
MDPSRFPDHPPIPLHIQPASIQPNSSPHPRGTKRRLEDLQDDYPQESTTIVPPQPPPPEDEEQSSQEADGPQPKKGKKKTKRKQLIACDACRLRRVKCGRTEGYGACPQCKQRGIQCTSNYILQKAKTPRAGKIVQQAKLLYGSTVPETNVPPELLAQEQKLQAAGSSPDQQTRQQQHQRPSSSSPVLSPTENQVGFEVLAKTLSKHLVETFLVMSHEQLPVLNVTLFRNWFDEATASDNLGVMGACLVAVMEAYGARITDSPMVLGPTAPRFADLKLHTHRSIDLSPYGRAREQFATFMVERALTKIDLAGAFRKPTAEGAAALVLLEMIVDYKDPSCKEGRFLISSAVQHIRMLREKELGGFGEKSSASSTHGWWSGRVRGNTLWWGLYVRDAWISCVGGMIPQFTEQDIELLSPELVDVKYESLISSLDNAESGSMSGFVLYGMLGHLMSLSRMVSAKITQLVARTKPYLDLAAVRAFFQGLDENASLLTNWAARRGTSTSRNKAQDRMVTFLMAKHNGGVPDEEDVEEFKYHQELMEMKRVADMRLFRVSREVARAVKEAMTSSHLYGGALGLPSLGLHGKAILDMPTVEYGGPEDWTIQDKVNELQWVLDSSRAIGWCWGDPDSHIQMIETAIIQLKGPGLPTTTHSYSSITFPPPALPTFPQFPTVLSPVIATPVEVASGLPATTTRSPTHLMHGIHPEEYYRHPRSPTMHTIHATPVPPRSAGWTNPPPPMYGVPTTTSQPHAQYHSYTTIPSDPATEWQRYPTSHEPQSFIQPQHQSHPHSMPRQFHPSYSHWTRDDRQPWDPSQPPPSRHQYPPAPS